MAEDIIKVGGSTKGSKPDSGNANLQTVPLYGIVKNNIDPVRAGRIQVYLKALSGDNENDANSWIWLRYMTTFFGHTDAIAGSGKEDYGTYKTNPSSYGLWHSPPELGSTVICIFVNGQQGEGYYIGSRPTPEALYMIPAIGSSDNIVANGGEAESYGGATRLPVSNINKNNPSINNSTTYWAEPKPIHSYTAMIMSQQGILRDPIRGPISTGAQRETPSRVGWGVSTPGRPIYAGGDTDDTIAAAASDPKTPPSKLKLTGRRNGHSIVMDDGDIIGNDNLIRIRTSLGHQIMMSDNGQTLMILHANGQSYIELGKEGTIDMYSTNSVNIRTQGDLNLHADNNININAKKNLNIQADNIKVNSENNYEHRVGGNFASYVAGKLTTLVTGAMSMLSSGSASYASEAITYINGSRINLNTGQTTTTPETVLAIPIVAHTDTLFDKIKGYVAAPGKLLSIVSRAPAHAPWVNACQGVDVQTSNNASSELPPAPPATVAAANTTAAASPVAAPAAAVVATAPPSSAVSGAIDKNTTGAVVAAAATNAATGPAALATKVGSAVVNTVAGPIAAVGSLAQTATQMASGGTLKPGADALVNTLVAGGANVAAAMTQNLFTGQSGAASLQQFISNPTAQVNNFVNNLQQAQAVMTQAGAITGKEAPQAIAGVVMAGATAGVGNVLNVLSSSTISNAIGGAIGGALTGGQNALGGALGGAISGALTGGAAGLTGALTSGIGSAIGGKLGGSLGSAVGSAIGGSLSGGLAAATNAISSGNLAAGLAAATGGLGAIGGALSKLAPPIPGLAGLLDTAKGAAASAFGAITKALKPLKAGVPQNLTAIAKANAEEQAGTVAAVSNPGGISGALGSAVSGALGGALGGALTSGLKGAVSGALGSAVAGVVGNTTGSLGNTLGAAVGSAVGGKLGGALGSAIGGAAGSLIGGGQITTSVASGINALPGGQNAVSTINNFATKSINSIPGVSEISNLVTNTSSAATNGISVANSVNSALTSAVGGAIGGALTGGAKSALSGALGSAVTGALSGAAGGLGSALSSGIGSAIGGKLAGVAGSALGGSLGNLLGSATGLSGALDKLKSGQNSLAALASAGLPAAAASQLNATLSSLNSGSAVPIGLPAVGLNTSDRSEVNAQIASVLPQGVPAPNFDGPSESAKTAQQAQADTVSEIVKLKERKAEIEKQRVQNVLAYSAAINAYDEAAKTLPQGSPELARLKQAEEAAKKTRRDYLISSYKELEQDIDKKLKALTG